MTSEETADTEARHLKYPQCFILFNFSKSSFISWGSGMEKEQGCQHPPPKWEPRAQKVEDEMWK